MTKWHIGFLGLLLVSLGGCSDGRPARVPVSGRVVIDGKPLNYGSVQFVPKGDRASSGQLDAEGKFSLTCFEQGDGAVPGTHRIAVLAAEPMGPNSQRWHAPQKYADFRNSGLTTEISGPADDLLIELSWNGGKPFVERFDSEQGQ